jgi:hypothetical protein
MQLVHAHKNSSYTFILTEDEWYSATEQQREAWINQIKREGAEHKCNNLNILVKPDNTMSISPVPHTHSVYCYIVNNVDRAERFRETLLGAYDSSTLSDAEKMAIVRSVFP